MRFPLILAALSCAVCWGQAPEVLYASRYSPNALMGRPEATSTVA